MNVFIERACVSVVCMYRCEESTGLPSDAKQLPVVEESADREKE